MISKELDIDFIHGDIHGRSCKNDYFINYVHMDRLMWMIRTMMMMTIMVMGKCE